jgi:hypothetical protein
MIASALILLCGCKATKMYSLEQYNNSNQGVIIGSIDWPSEGPVYSPLKFKFRSTSTGKKYTIEAVPSFNIYSGKTKVQFSDGGYQGTTFAIALPTGEYEFFNYEMEDIDRTRWSSEEDYSIPFNVKANQTSYLGEIKLHVKTTTDFLGGYIFHGGFWTVNDESVRDINIFKKHQPEHSLDDISIDILSQKRKFTRLVLLQNEKIN